MDDAQQERSSLLLRFDNRSFQIGILPERNHDLTAQSIEELRDIKQMVMCVYSTVFVCVLVCVNVGVRVAWIQGFISEGFLIIRSS